MKSTGIVRRIDDLGRIIIPKEVRKTLHLQGDDLMEIFIEDGGVLFKRYNAEGDFLDLLEKLNDIIVLENYDFKRRKRIIQLIDDIKEEINAEQEEREEV